MTARCKPWVTVIVALTVFVAVAIADEEINDGKATAALLGDTKLELASKVIGDRSDPPRDKQYFIYYNPRAQERDDEFFGTSNDEQIVSDEQGRSSDVVKLLDLGYRNGLME